MSCSKLALICMVMYFSACQSGDKKQGAQTSAWKKEEVSDFHFSNENSESVVSYTFSSDGTLSGSFGSYRSGISGASGEWKIDSAGRLHIWFAPDMQVWLAKVKIINDSVIVREDDQAGASNFNKYEYKRSVLPN